MTHSSSSSWVKTITSPFRKACHTIFNNQQQHSNSSSSSIRDHKKSHRQTAGAGGGGEGARGGIMDLHLHGEVMACGYEDVQVMWSILDKPNTNTPTSSPIQAASPAPFCR